MRRASPARPARARGRAAAAALLAALLAGCAPQPTAQPSAEPTLTVPAAVTSTLAAAPATPGATTSRGPTPTATGPRELSVCLAEEPASLYVYARPEAGRAHVLAALYDGPIDAHDYTHTPALVAELPSAANGGVQTRAVTASPGETVVDTLGRVLPLAAGLRLLQPDGSVRDYDGLGPVALPQVTVTFRLRPELRWSDGQPLTAADSVFAYELGRSPESVDPRQPLAERTLSYSAPDPITVVWTGLPGYVDPLAFTHLWPPLPRHRWAGLSAVEIADSEDANRQPLGWGPFVLQEWLEGERLVAVRNPHFWRAAEGLPRLDRVEFVFVDGAGELARQLLSGECDLAPSGPGLDEAAARLAARPGALRLLRVPGPVLEHVDFGLLPAGRPPLLGDERVRQALAHCLDRQGLAPYPDWPVPASYLPAAHPLHAAEVASYAFDPARGRALLAEAGWDFETELTLVGGPAEDPARERLLAALQSAWQQHCGVAIAIQPLTLGELAGDWPQGVVFGRRFDLAVFGWRVGAAPPCALYTSAEIAGGDNPAGANAAGYANPAYDEACRRALTAADPAVSAAAHAEAQRRLAADLPLLPLYFRPRHGAAGPGVEGYRLDGSSESELWNLEVIEIK